MVKSENTIYINLNNLFLNQWRLNEEYCMVFICLFIGSAIMAAKDAGDAVSLWQSLVGSTFDSSQLVLIACMGYQFIDEIQLQELRAKNRPLVLAALSERSQWRSSKRSFSSKTFSNRGNSNGSQIKSADHDNDISNGQRLSIQEELENNSLPAVTVQRDDLDDDEICVADILEQVLTLFSLSFMHGLSGWGEEET